MRSRGMRRALALLVIAACGSSPTDVAPDAGASGDALDDVDAAVDPDAPLPVDPFWAPCGNDEVDLPFLDSGVPFAVARDGTMYSVITSGSTVIARKRPGQPAEMTWLTVAPQQLYAVEALAPGPGGVLYFTGYVDNVHGLYRVAGNPPTPTRLGDVLPNPDYFDVLQHTGERLYMFDDQGRDLWLVDLVTRARTSAAHHPCGILHCVFESPSVSYLTSYNAPLTRVTLDANGIEASRSAVTAFGADTVYKVGIDQKGRIYGMTFPNNSAELLERVDP